MANKLLQVKITIDDQGKLGKVDHPDCKLNRDANLPFSGTQYGWSLEGYTETGIDLQAFGAQTAAVAPNPPANKAHCNTIQPQPPVLLKLDVGHWGAYHRWREYPNGPKADGDSKEKGIQREFGLIENHHVWLCRFNGQQAVPATLTAFQYTNCKLAAQIVQHLAADLGIDIIADAPVTDPRSADLDDETLYVLFPDLHLPETLPDFPPEEKRNQEDPEARKKLRKLLRGAQQQPGVLFGSSVDTSQQQAVQAYLESIHVQPGATLPQEPVWKLKAGKNVVYFTPEQFLAEKAIVDREVMLTSTWFYARGPDWDKDAIVDRDVAAQPGDDGDPTPAIDLAHLLCAIKKVRNDAYLCPDPGNIQVIQVGDLYELWLNHEFLYRDFDVDDSFEVSAGEKRAYFGIWQQGSKSDDYQYRMDAGWDDPANGEPKEKRYVYNYWPKADMLLRYKIGADYADPDDSPLLPEQLDRLQQLLLDRVKRVRAYSLYDPGTKGCVSLRAMDSTVLDFKSFYRKTRDQRKGEIEEGQAQDDYFKDRQGYKEVFWNEMILSLLADLEFRNIGGNHDGYRADPLLNGLLDGVDQAETIISEPGLWIEHSHRWDEFNRDGMAFGAGAANYVYYYFRDLCSKSAGWWEDMLGQQEQTCFVPGAALWFAIANFGSKLDWVKKQHLCDDLKPFGVYVSGHTHSASLARITFKLPSKPRGGTSASSAGAAPPPTAGGTTAPVASGAFGPQP